MVIVSCTSENARPQLPLSCWGTFEVSDTRATLPLPEIAGFSLWVSLEEDSYYFGPTLRPLNFENFHVNTNKCWPHMNVADTAYP